MILEIAILDIRSGQSASFEASFEEAQTYLSGIEGYQRHELRKCIEKVDRYLLLAWWDTLESHTEGFRGSPEYERWRELLHHYYEPFPEVEHYERVALSGQ
ncbi:MAG: antibiotic biosynthesis monooxygenase [bacterium]|nr:antibiotic biosynthesis monooxygenase [bacterium]